MSVKKTTKGPKRKPGPVTVIVPGDLDAKKICDRDEVPPHVAHMVGEGGGAILRAYQRLL